MGKVGFIVMCCIFIFVDLQMAKDKKFDIQLKLRQKPVSHHRKNVMRYKDSDILFKKLFYCYLKKKKMCLLYIASNIAT